MSRRVKIILVSVAVVIGLLLLSMLVVPWQVKKQGIAWVAENTERTLTVEKVFFNPFTLTIELNNLKLTEPTAERPFVSFSRLMLSISLRSILDRALILDRVELDDPYVNIELLGKQEFNFSDFTRLGKQAPAEESAEQQDPFHFSLNNIVLANGSIDFTDLTSEKKSHHRVRELNLAVPFIGNVPYLTDDYVEPQLSMFLNDAEVKAGGQLKPFHDSLETQLHFSFHNVDLAFYAFHSPLPLPVEVKQGNLDFEVDVAYLVSRDEQPRLQLGGTLAISDLDLRETDAKPLFSTPTLIVDLDWADVFQKDFNLASFELFEPQLYIDRDAAGQWNFQRLLPEQPIAETTAEPPSEGAGEETAAPLLFNVEKLSLSDGQIHFRDDSVGDGFQEEIRGISIEAGLSNHFAEETPVSLQFRTDRELSLEIQGNLGIDPPLAHLDLLANGLPLAPYYPYLESFLTAAPAGTLNLAGQVEYSSGQGLRVQQVQLTLRDLLLPFTEKDHFSLAEFNLSGSSFDLPKKQISLGSMLFNKGEVIATRLPDGSFSPLRLLREQPPAEEPQETATPETEEPAEPWQLSLGSIDLNEFHLLFTDATLPRQPRVEIPGFAFHAESISYPQSSKSPFSLSARIGSNGTVQVEGTAAHSPLALKTQSSIKAFPLADFNDFIPEDIRLRLKDGQLFASLALSLQQGPEVLTGEFAGKAGISRFNLRDPLDGGELLTWENLNLEGINGTIVPFSLHLKEVALSNYLAKIQIAPDGKINLANVTAEPAAELQEPPAEQDAVEDSSPPPDIRVDALTLQGGTVSFTDRHLPDTFSTTMYRLGGRVSGLASDAQMQADVDLRGQLENHAPLTITGKINPLSEDLFADLKISFKDIDLTPLTPYSGTYLGYVIDKGKLYLDLNYHIDHQQITADNKVMIDQFNFGETVKSDKATSLPVALAIALLKDRNDEIHLDIPVSGNLNDPDFSLAGTIFTVIRNLLVKAATSPFALLTSVLGSDQDFSSISFPPGIARIDTVQRDKLAELAGVLAERSSLTLEISAFADREQDPEAYRQDQLQQMLLAVKQRELAESGTTAADQPLQISPGEYPELLTTVYKEAEFPRPKNFVGMLKTLPVPEMEKLLLANIQAGDEQLVELAKRRALVVRDTLEQLNPELKPRLFLKKTDIYQAPKEGPASRVEFNISTK